MRIDQNLWQRATPGYCEIDFIVLVLGFYMLMLESSFPETLCRMQMVICRWFVFQSRWRNPILMRAEDRNRFTGGSFSFHKRKWPEVHAQTSSCLEKFHGSVVGIDRMMCTLNSLTLKKRVWQNWKMWKFGQIRKVTLCTFKEKWGLMII